MLTRKSSHLSINRGVMLATIAALAVTAVAPSAAFAGPAKRGHAAVSANTGSGGATDFSAARRRHHGNGGAAAAAAFAGIVGTIGAIAASRSYDDGYYDEGPAYGYGNPYNSYGYAGGGGYYPTPYGGGYGGGRYVDPGGNILPR